ncbi:GNAT family N-acetyltransferase [Consotaella aegiceratis]|uniref:GNAT family N-acetyltransferase n=1 Tax=Consotaella aegiceratis TaxID=3097961 RepID=UPI002F405FE3
MAASDVPGIATPETVIEMYRHNPDTMMEIVRTSDAHDDNRETGLIALLPLNAAGDQALFSGELDTVAPARQYICRPSETAVSVYVWGIWVTPRLSGGIAHLMERLSSNKFRAAPLYCKAANEKALHFFETLGFIPGTEKHGRLAADILHYQRRVEAVATPEAPGSRLSIAKPYDSFDPAKARGTRLIGIKVVHSLDELLQVLAIRGSAYIGEQGIPYNEDVDGNDFTGTHLIGYVGAEPAACLRLRYFSDFVKLERLAVLPRFRSTRIAFRMVRAAIAFAREKGYHKFYGQAEASIYPLWRRFGFQAREGSAVSYLTERTYLEGDLETPRPNEYLTAHSGAYVLLRPEGRWHEVGRLEANDPAGGDPVGK